MSRWLLTVVGNRPSQTWSEVRSYFVPLTSRTAACRESVVYVFTGQRATILRFIWATSTTVVQCPHGSRARLRGQHGDLPPLRHPVLSDRNKRTRIDPANNLEPLVTLILPRSDMLVNILTYFSNNNVLTCCLSLHVVSNRYVARVLYLLTLFFALR